MIMTPITTVRVIKGALEETELAALIITLDMLSRSASAASQRLPTRPRRATWIRTQRRWRPWGQHTRPTLSSAPLGR